MLRDIREEIYKKRDSKQNNRITKNTGQTGNRTVGK